jgi:hypothetical protein
VRTKRGNQTILVVMYTFSTFLVFYPLCNITSAVVFDILERRYFTAYGVPNSIVSGNAKVFKSKAFYDFCFNGSVREFILHRTIPRVLLQ